MSLNATPSAERVHIGFFGMRNAGKSSLVNAVTGQNLSLVSPTKGTTTDPVKKAMEILPLGPVVIIDTPGLDDEGDLGKMRVERAKEVLDQVQIAVLVVDATKGLSREDALLEAELGKRKIPHIMAHNKCDLAENPKPLSEKAIYVSAVTGHGITQLKEKLAGFASKTGNSRPLIKDLIAEKDTVVLVTPIDESAPKGRIILPQQMVLREILDSKAIAVVAQPSEIEITLKNLGTKPRMVITDSQAFHEVSKIVPESIPLTSFSILMARYKGDLSAVATGISALETLKDGDKVLISEGCTHHRQCNDIGTAKMPRWIEDFSGAKPDFSFTSGGDFPKDLSPYRLIVHCGGCMLTEAEMQRRIATTKEAKIPILNYGLAIAAMNGIVKRSTSLFPEIFSKNKE